MKDIFYHYVAVLGVIAGCCLLATLIILVGKII